VKTGVWPELVDEYLEARRVAGIKPQTLLGKRGALKGFLAFLRHHPVVGPVGLTRRTLEAYVDYLREDYRVPWGAQVGRRIGAQTLYDHVTVVLSFVGFLVRAGRILVDPRAGFERPRPCKRRRWWVPSEGEVRRFLSGIRPRGAMALRDRALFELLYSTGLRASEASRLDLYDLDLAGGSLRVRLGKGGRDRVVPLGRVAARYVCRYFERVRALWATRETGEALFVTPFGTRVSPLVMGVRCRLWRARAGLPRLTPHVFRHAAATHMLAGGADVRHVQAFLGHEWISSTEVYTHTAIRDLARTHRRCHPREVKARARGARLAVPEEPGAQRVLAADDRGVPDDGAGVRGVPGLGRGGRSS
jgi:integrase/recombinase XerD